jgi:hypothetical protein
MKVFISYTSRDEPLATRLVAYLEKAGLDAWYQNREVLPGDNWAEKIAQGLKESNAMIVLVSADAMKSDSVRSSISYALGEKAFNGRLIPVFVGDSKYSDSVPWIFNRFKTFTLPEFQQFAEEEQFQKIAQLLKEAA